MYLPTVTTNRFRGLNICSQDAETATAYTSVSPLAHPTSCRAKFSMTS
ncbi:MAG: hypothetical protein IKQ61_04960 [Spirochaetales bacterium]|nr:hypothetical protein [Spirochaetales bacterium]